MAEKPQDSNEEVWYNIEEYKFKRLPKCYKNLNDAEKELEDIKAEYNCSRNRCYMSFAALDTINVAELNEKWGKEHNRDDVPMSITAKLTFEQKLVNWTHKYKKDPSNIEYLIHKIINDKKSM